MRARRAQIAKWTLLANRVGYLARALAVALFVIAFMVGFSAPMATLVVVAMIVSFVSWCPRSSSATRSRRPNATISSMGTN